MARRKTRVEVDDDPDDLEEDSGGSAKLVKAATIVEIDARDLDKLTAARIVGIHCERIFNDYDPGEVELVMQFFHLLHARKYSLNPDDVDTRRSDFDEQMKLVFDGQAA